MDPATWAVFALASLALVVTPGPTVLLVISQALSRGRRVAVAAAAGVALGDLIAMSASLAGLGALVMASAALFTAFKWIGAVYLVYLGLRLLGARPSAMAPGAPTAGGRAVAFRQAAVVTALNPKGIAFFVAFVPQFVDPDRPLAPQFAAMTATFVALGGLNALAYALLADRLRARIERPRVMHALSRTGGAALIAMGAASVLARRPPA